MMGRRTMRSAEIRAALRHPLPAVVLVSGSLVSLWSGGVLLLRAAVPISQQAPATEEPKARAGVELQEDSGTGPGAGVLSALQRLPRGVARPLQQLYASLDRDRPRAASNAREHPQAPIPEARSTVASVSEASAPSPAPPTFKTTDVPPAEELFPTSPALSSAVEFWRKVYRDYDSDHYLIHDRDTFMVVAVLDLSHVPDIPRQRDRILNAELSDYSKRIRRLGDELAGGGSVSNLPAEEQRWLAALMQVPERNPFTASSERLRVQRGQRDQFVAGLRRSGRYMDLMCQVFRRWNLPTELCYLPHVESSFNEQAVSRAGASGIWQLMPATARLFLQVTRQIDERNDPLIATEAAARVLDKNYRHLGTWPLALTAYNHGLSGMLRAVHEVGDTDLGVILKQYSSKSFGFASRNFYCEFLAAKGLAENAGTEFPWVVPEPPLAYEELTLRRPMTLPALASTLKVEPKSLEALNPALLEPIRTGKRMVPTDYPVRLPGRPGSDLIALVDPLPPNQGAPPPMTSAAIRPAPGSEQAKPAAPESPEQSPLVHTVRVGDTLGALAKRYGTTVRQIVSQNSLRSAHRLRVGQRLRISAAS
jgi:peptidoglycan lytic transglycosylase D